MTGVGMKRSGGSRAAGSVAEHGTYAGSQAHRTAGEAPCLPCIDAQAAYGALWRFRAGRRHDLRRCPDCGSAFANHRCSMAVTE